MKSIRLGDLAKQLSCELQGSADIVIEKVSLSEDAASGSIVYVADPKRVDKALKSRASALLVPSGTRDGKKPMLISRNPKLAFAKLLSIFHSGSPRKAGVHPSAIIDKTAILESGSSIGACAVIGARARIGKRAKIGPFVFIDDEAVVGDDTEIHAGVKILHHVAVGKRCVLYAGCVIGSDGFGYATDENGTHTHVPQVGTVILEDDVAVGANSTIDRATLGRTRIGHGTKIDNLVHIAHNCDIGANCFIAAVVGIAGSTVIEDGVMVGGHTGIRDHVRIGEKAIIGAASNVWGNVDSGEFVSGTPARPHKEQVKLYALIRKLPELIKRLESLEKR